MALLKLVVEPDPLLHEVSAPVDHIDEKLQKFMDDMLETMYEEKGGGLAAVQVGVLKRILIFDPRCYLDDETVEGPLFMINPEITYFSDEQCNLEEGCLSVPGSLFEIKRAENVTVKFLDYHGKPQELHASGITARGIQHEMDHLNGITLLNRVSKIRKELALKKIKKLYKQD